MRGGQEAVGGLEGRRERGRSRGEWKTETHRRETWFTVQKRPISTRGYSVLMYAAAGWGRSSDVSPPHPPLPMRTAPLVFQCYYAGTVNTHTQTHTRARFATPSGPPAYNGCAEGCTMANKHTGSRLFLSARQLVHMLQRRGFY